MQESRDHIILIISALTLVFLVAGGFVLLIVVLYSKRKKRHIDEKKALHDRFRKELIQSQLEVQEQTLQTVGKDIHDNIGQLLSLAKLTLSSVNVQQPEKTELKIAQSVTIVETSIRELRQLANVLHAENFLSEGLEKAIEKEVNWIRKTDRYKIVWEVDGQKPMALEKDRELIAFRLVQELLNNIIKHANASLISVQLTYHAADLHLVIRDDGKGFDVTKTRQQHRGLGLHNFYNRAALIHGTFELQSVPGTGTVAFLSIPYRHTHAV